MMCMSMSLPPEPGMPAFMTISRVFPVGRVRLRRLLPAALTLLATVAAVVPTDGRGQSVGETGAAADRAAIRAAAAAYRTALAKGDAAAVKAAWTADADIVDGRGQRVRPADIAPVDAGPAAASRPRPEVTVGETTIRFLTGDVAVEDGTADIVLPGAQTAIEGWFSALWVRRDGGWKLAGVRESERPVVADASMLADLDWMVGDWTVVVDEPAAKGAPAAKTEGGKAASPAMDMNIRWDEGRAFLVRDVRIAGAGTDDGDADVVHVHQRIGWDPLVKRIRSWSFSSDGSRAEATWFRDGGSWVIVQTAYLPGGQQHSQVSIYTPDGPDRCVWRTMPDALSAADGRPTRATWVRKPKGEGR